MSTNEAIRTTTPGPWLAHEWPERPLDDCCWICSCPACQLAVEATAMARPRLAFVLKTGMDRIVVTCELTAAVWRRTGSLANLLCVRGDYIREVFVAAGAHDVPRDWDWCSAAGSERRLGDAWRTSIDLGPRR